MANKLLVNSIYSVYTKLDTINGAKVKVVGILNYEEAIDNPFKINTLAINEKVVNTENGVSTDKYLRSQLYYLCKYTDDTNKILILWDDIIDSQRTTRLNVDYDYKVTFSVNDEFQGSIQDVVLAVTALLHNEYPTQVEATFTATGIKSRDERSSQLEETLDQYRDLLSEAMNVVQKLASLKQIETAIDMFVKGEFNNKMESLIDQISVLQEAVATISSVVV